MVEWLSSRENPGTISREEIDARFIGGWREWRFVIVWRLTTFWRGIAKAFDAFR